MIVVLVCGSRSWSDREAVFARLDELLVESAGEMFVIHGGARGADRMAQEWLEARGRDNDHDRRVFPVTDADWKRYKKAAGMRRNRRMLVELQSLADGAERALCVAFRSAGEGRGTDGMVGICRGASVAVEVVSPT